MSYWQEREFIKKWKARAEHLEAQSLGNPKWYTGVQNRMSNVERDHEM